MVRINVVGPEIDEYFAFLEKVRIQNGITVEEQLAALGPRYYRDDPDRAPDSVRGCFLDELYSKRNVAQKFADEFYDGDVPYMLENFDNLSDLEIEQFMHGYQVTPGPRADRKYHVLFYGMSGYTGACLPSFVTAMYLHKNGVMQCHIGSMIMEFLKRDCKDDVKVAFAGRTLHKVVAMRDKVMAGTKWAKTDCIAADLANPFDVERIVTSCRCIVNVAGPFMLTGGENVVEACIHYDTDYCDVSGEIPWSARLLEFHDLAWEAGVYIVPSAAFAGGMPDVLTYMAVREVWQRFGEPTRKVHGYVEGGGDAMAPSGGTLQTRAAMAQSGAKTKELMSNPFALGGSIQNGEREEDQDKVLSDVFHDQTIKKWVSPHVYSFFESRVVRRSNYLHHRLVGGPNKGAWYGCSFNFTAHLIAESEAKARASKASKTSTKAEEQQLKAAGKYYAAGEGPPINELIASGAYSVFHVVAESEDTKRRICFSIKGHDGYYETARMVTEMGIMLALDSPKLRSGKQHVRGGLLTPGIAGRKVYFDRLIQSGLGFVDWSESRNLPNAKEYACFNMQPMEGEKEANE